ncbi:hypothetical protein GCM10009838_18600 [Catenulispora subtropica]|uniref:non-specific serine/threonine protein kinase n=1 Tax=Catenulispora subtropica TaxID=450798 RepID=A0ABP5CD47_9ACTN
MGEVWRCRDPRIGRDVAVKVLLDVRMSEESSPRFEREARVAGGLASRSIVAVYDYGQGELDGRAVPYLVMELVDGESLDQVVARELATLREPDVGRALRWTDRCAPPWRPRTVSWCTGTSNPPAEVVRCSSRWRRCSSM